MDGCDRWTSERIRSTNSAIDTETIDCETEASSSIWDGPWVVAVEDWLVAALPRVEEVVLPRVDLAFPRAAVVAPRVVVVVPLLDVVPLLEVEAPLADGVAAPRLDDATCLVVWLRVILGINPTGNYSADNDNKVEQRELNQPMIVL